MCQQCVHKAGDVKTGKSFSAWNEEEENVVGEDETRFRSHLVVCNRIHYTIQFIIVFNY